MDCYLRGAIHDNMVMFAIVVVAGSHAIENRLVVQAVRMVNFLTVLPVHILAYELIDAEYGVAYCTELYASESCAVNDEVYGMAS